MISLKDIHLQDNKQYVCELVIDTSVKYFLDDYVEPHLQATMFGTAAGMFIQEVFGKHLVPISLLGDYQHQEQSVWMRTLILVFLKM